LGDIEMKNKDALYKEILTTLHPLLDELDKIDAELSYLHEFDEFTPAGHTWSEYDDKTHERATYLRREIAWWEAYLEEVML